MTAASRHVVVVGGGYAGLTVARRLLRRGRGIDVTVVDPHGYMTYRTPLPEVTAGTVPGLLEHALDSAPSRRPYTWATRVGQ